MRPLVVSVSCLFLLGLGCNSSGKDPEAAARAAKSAAGSLTKPATKEPVVPGDGPTVEDEKLPHIGKPGKVVKPPPSVGTATCITDDGDDPTDHTDDPDDVKKPGDFKGPGTIEKLDPKTPQVEGAMPKSAKTTAGAKTIGDDPKLGKKKGTKALARSSTDGTAAKSTSVSGTRVDWASMCDSKMDASSCEDLCGSKGLTWDRSAGTNGTCFELTSPASSDGSTSTTAVQCGCMCLPGS